MKNAVQFGVIDNLTKKPKYIITEEIKNDEFYRIGEIALELKEKYLSAYILIKVMK